MEVDNGLNGEHAFMGGSMGIKSFPRDTQFYKIKAIGDKSIFLTNIRFISNFTKP